MKKLYTVMLAFAFGAFSTQVMGQANLQKKDISYDLSKSSTGNDIENSHRSLAKGGDEEVIYFEEDFSNGFDGQGSNGVWTTDNDQGDLWFYTFPMGQPNGFDPNSSFTDPDLVNEYGQSIPNYFNLEVDSLVSSETRDNGLMMIDADRWNSTCETPDCPPAPNTQSVAIAAELVSPPIDLTGVTDARLIYSQKIRLCCSGYSASAEVTTDGGQTWAPFDSFSQFGQGNDRIDVSVTHDLQPILEGASDLSAVQIRFNFAGAASHYYWEIDDVKIIETPENDLVAGITYFNDYSQQVADAETGEITAAEYYRQFEYFNQPADANYPLDLGMAVTNTGQLVQNDVVVEVTATAPGGNTVVWESDAVTLESGVTDTIFLPQHEFSEVSNDVESGEYTFEYSVSAGSIVDGVPEDNVGTQRATNLNRASDADLELAFSMLRNDGNNYQGAFPDNGNDHIWGTAYSFNHDEAAEMMITHVEAVFLFADGFAETQAGEGVFFNVREGSIFFDDTTRVFFDSDNNLEYADPDMLKIIEEDDIWNTADGFPFVWASQELPSPILVNADSVYQAEYRVQPGADAADQLVLPPVSSPQDTYSSVFYSFFPEDQSWIGAGLENELAFPIRFRMNLITSSDQVSYDSGIVLKQNYPNPFVDQTQFQYRLDKTDDTRLEVFDITGKMVYAEDLGTRNAGIAYNYTFENQNLSAGTYTYSIVTSDARLTRKMTVK
jgi:hypothetical protein